MFQLITQAISDFAFLYFQDNETATKEQSLDPVRSHF